MSTQLNRLKKLERTAKPRRVDVEMPLNAIDFATNERFLGLQLFPRQATVLKLLLLQIDLLTPFDREVINEWADGYTPTDMIDGRRWTGRSGIVPDIIDRAQRCLDAGRWTFRESVLVLGRRASKSLLSSVVIAWQLWRLLMLDDPQHHFGLPPGKRIMVLAYSTTQLSVSRDVFGDIAGRIQQSPCFQPFKDKITETTITLFTPAQLRRGDPARGLAGLIEINAAPTVSSSARGPAAFMLVLDEAAHIDGRGSTNTADEVRTAAKPALAQFAKESTVLMPSTPWSMTGAFFDAFQRATDIGPDGKSVDPYRFVLQLPSWALYVDHELADTLPMWPNGPAFAATPAPFITDNDDLQAARAENPEAFSVEFEAQFISGVGAYFTAETINRLFGSFNGAPVTMTSRGDGISNYVIHCDPSTSGDNFAITVGHAVKHDGRVHAIVDHIEVFRPQDFPNHSVDYNVVLPRLLGLIDAFRPTALYFDNHNAEFFTDRLAPEIPPNIGTQVAKVSCNQIEKFARYERLKTRANLEEAHVPAYPLAVEEARFLQRDGLHIEHPTSGPCQTDDVIDALSWLIDHLIGRNSHVHAALSAVTPIGTDLPGPFDAFYRETRRTRQEVPNPARFDHRSNYTNYLNIQQRRR